MRLIDDHTLACPFCFSDGPQLYGIDAFYDGFVGILFKCGVCGALSSLQVDGQQDFQTTIEWKIVHPGKQALRQGRR